MEAAPRSGRGGRTPGIPDRLHRWLLERAADGKTTREIADLLGSEHGIETTYTSVSRLLVKLREQRAEVTRAVIAEKVGRHVTADLDRLDKLREEAERRGKAETDNEVWVKLAEEERKIIDMKLKRSGGDEPGGTQGNGVLVLPAEDRNA
jgi:hypothetical protein